MINKKYHIDAIAYHKSKKEQLTAAGQFACIKGKKKLASNLLKLILIHDSNIKHHSAILESDNAMVKFASSLRMINDLICFNKNI